MQPEARALQALSESRHHRVLTTAPMLATPLSAGASQPAMMRILDIIQVFLGFDMHGYLYLRLEGATTQIEDWQYIWILAGGGGGGHSPEERQVEAVQHVVTKIDLHYVDPGGGVCEGRR
ncbi:hypothetical protein BD413DRAFT_615833 [Trametes elegans]|nr:hypothetical protein BD413DRAFT_615833 [Trametes elegans]